MRGNHRTYFGCDNLESYFKNLVETHGKAGLHSFAELVEIAKLLVKRYARIRGSRGPIEFLETCTEAARGDPERAWET